MRIKLKELMTKLGVTYQLQPYETCPWSHHEEEKGETYSGEARMDAFGEECEAEFQIWYDEEKPGKPPLDQVLRIKCGLHKGMWGIDGATIRGEDFVNKFYGWDDKACNLFRALCQEVAMGQAPDIDALIKEHMKESRTGNMTGDGGSKSPRIRPEQLLDMKQGGGGF